MSLALALKPLDELFAQHGPMRTVIHHAMHETAVPREQYAVYAHNVFAGKTLRESVVKADNGTPIVVIRLAEYIEPVTLATRYAVDYWSLGGFWTTDHEVRAVAEAAYEEAVRQEFANPTRWLRLSPARFLGGLAHFYDETDVL
ncbi:hypothetical protein AB0H92_22100 [Streptomyces phaeochromogenes]|uniref:hypothetical protein n=1 Tax=Streptomyces phaeochromogenes TaxID=1923 RepID=UPI0033EE1DEA